MMNKSMKSPIICRWILTLINKNRDDFSVLGDYEEEYFARYHSHGKQAAKKWYRRQALRSLFPFLGRSIRNGIDITRIDIQLMLRQLRKQFQFAFLNLFGLILGLVCFIFILIFIKHETGYDQFHELSHRIYRMGTFLNLGNSGSGALAVSNFPAAPQITQMYPEVEKFLRLRPLGQYAQLKKDEVSFEEPHVFFADSSFFEIFSFVLINGNKKTVLRQPNTAVLTESCAEKIFGKASPIGRTVEINGHLTVTVTGVMADVPAQSHIDISMLISFSTLTPIVGEQMNRWMGDFGNYTYLLLSPEADPVQLEQRFHDLVSSHIQPILDALGGELRLFLQPLEAIHLHSNFRGEYASTTNITYIYTFSMIAFFILIIACINYVNMATAKSSCRIREISMKKAMGAHRAYLIRQFLFESLAISFVATLFSVVLVSVTAPYIVHLFQFSFPITFQHLADIFPCLIIVFLAVGFFSGGYPALYLTSFNPITGFQKKGGKGASRFRNTLVVIQFTISIILIACTLTIGKQFRYLRHFNMGFDESNVVVLPFDQDHLTASLESIKSQLIRQSDVLNVSLASYLPGNGSRHNYFQFEGGNIQESVLMATFSADAHFPETMKIELKEGRLFDKTRASDISNAVLVNETLVNQLGWRAPLGKVITELDDDMTPKKIIGVISDFHTQSLHELVSPLVIEMNPFSYRYLIIRYREGKAEELLSMLENKWTKISPADDFNYFFLDQSFDNLYRTEQRLQLIFIHFTIFALVIALLGLLGLAAFLTERRSKEMGIRKVLGGRWSHLVGLLTYDMVKWVLLANVFAWPILWFLLSSWLHHYPYRISIPWENFLVAALFALLSSIGAIMFQTVKAGLANPVDILREE